jgi:hypothetical protein
MQDSENIERWEVSAHGSKDKAARRFAHSANLVPSIVDVFLVRA